MLKRGYALAAACLAAAVAVTAFTPNGKFALPPSLTVGMQFPSWIFPPWHHERPWNIGKALFALHPVQFQHVSCHILCVCAAENCSDAIDISCRNRITANPRIGVKCRRRTLASTPPHTKLTANECDICCLFLCRRQLRQGIRKGIGFSFMLCFKLFNCNDCILHIGSPHIALSTISQPANPSIYHFNMNMSQCSPLGVR